MILSLLPIKNCNMRIRWTNYAIIAYSEVLKFLVNCNGVAFARKFRARVNNYQRILRSDPLIGSVELSLSDRPLSYRKCVVDEHHKIIYYVGNNEIVVADVWDTRQDPDYLSSRI